jgi:cytochrome c556
MKKMIVLSSVVFFAVVTFAFAAGDAKPELRPSQKAMQARAAWMKAMGDNLGAKKFEDIGRDAGELAAQTKKAGPGIANPLGKEITLTIASLAGDISTAAVKKDGDAVKARLGDIKAKCGECHTKVRDKK